MSIRKKAMVPGSLKRLTIWLLLIATWEAAYRVFQWEPVTFPAPSHVLDGGLALLQFHTSFGEPTSAPNWPWQPMTDAERAGYEAQRTGQPETSNPYSQAIVARAAKAEDWLKGYRVGELIQALKAARICTDNLPTSSLHPTQQAGLNASLAGKGALANPFANTPYKEVQQQAMWKHGYEQGHEHWYNSPLVEALIVSSIRLGIGFSISIAIGAVVGAIAWRFPAIDEFIGPVLLGIQTLPSICWVPLAMIIFGINEQGIMFVLAMGSFSAVAIALRDGLRAIPPLYQQAGRMMGARGWRLYWYVLLPASLPALATSLRQGFSFAWRSLMGAELILTAIKFKGLGLLLSVARDSTAVEQVVALLIVMILIGMLTDRWIFAKLQKRISQRFGLAPR